MRSKINVFVGPQAPLLATVNRRKLAWFRYLKRQSSTSEIIHQGTSERLGRVDAVVDRENAGWTRSKSGHFCPYQNTGQCPLAEKTGRGTLLSHPLRPLDDPLGKGTELNNTVKANCKTRRQSSLVTVTLTFVNSSFSLVLGLIPAYAVRFCHTLFLAYFIP